MVTSCPSLLLPDSDPVFHQILNTAAEGSSIPAPIHHTLPHTHTHTCTHTLHSTDPMQRFIFHSKGQAGGLTHAG